MRDMFDLLVSYFHQKHHRLEIRSKAVLRIALKSRKQEADGDRGSTLQFEDLNPAF
jgi:hypothetical protein